MPIDRKTGSWSFKARFFGGGHERHGRSYYVSLVQEALVAHISWSREPNVEPGPKYEGTIRHGTRAGDRFDAPNGIRKSMDGIRL